MTAPTESDTPRTDAAITNEQGSGWPCYGELADFTRSLERENNRMREALEDIKTHIENYGMAYAINELLHKLATEALKP